MRHGVRYDIDADRVGFLDGKLFKIPLFFPFAFSPVAEVGVMTNEDHDATMIVVECAIVWHAGI